MILELEPIVEKYASIYCINKNSVLDIIRENTDDFDIDNFVWNKNISNTEEIYDNFTSQVFFLVRDINNNPSKYSEYNIERCYDIDPQVGDMTIREFVYETADIVGLDKDMALAIPCAEHMYFQMVGSDNDSYGMVGHSFYNIYHGIIEGICNIKYKYVDKGASTYMAMAHIYCPPNPEEWVNLVKSCENKLKNGYKLYDEYDKELSLDRSN